MMPDSYEQTYHIVVVDETGTVTVETVQADSLDSAKHKSITDTGIYARQVIAVRTEHGGDEAAEIAHHAQTGINAYKHLLNWVLDNR